MAHNPQGGGPPLTGRQRLLVHPVGTYSPHFVDRLLHKKLPTKERIL